MREEHLQRGAPLGRCTNLIVRRGLLGSSAGAVAGAVAGVVFDVTLLSDELLSSVG